MKSNVWRQCGKKNRYSNESKAYHYKKKYERERGIKLDIYWCTYCNGYHLTSKEWQPFKNNCK